VEDGELLVGAPVATGTAVRPRGDDLVRGTGLAEAGERLTPGHLAALAAAGVGRVRVRRRPRVALVLTGDEVVPADAELAPGQVHEADGPLVAGWLEDGGWGRVEAVHVRDRLDETEAAVGEALDRADLVLTTGGVSVGDRDHVVEAAERSGVRTVFWRVAQKPGKPLLFGLRDGTVLLGLPGNPGSVHACLVTHVRRALELLEGAADPAPRPRPGTLAAPFRPDPRREWWARCRVEVEEGGVRLHPQGGQASHMVAELGRCHALARIPRGEATLEAGTPVGWVPAAGTSPYS
jgi:molybdopterin molybdotransferase